jgi:hypothetical protein
MEVAMGSQAIKTDVVPLEAGRGWRVRVTVAEGRGQTEHEVTVDRATYERLTDGGIPPEALVRESFAFLLEREPNESILRTFDLAVIGRYFPEYEGEIRRRLGVQ